MNENDYKYVMQDISTTHIGARYTYEEILKNDRVPFKLQSVIRIYIAKETPMETEVAAHLLSLEQGSLTYDIYENLKMKVHFYESSPKGGYVQKQMKLKEFFECRKQGWKADSMIHEVTISNLALMAFSV